MPTFLDLLEQELRAAVLRRSQAASPAAPRLADADHDPDAPAHRYWPAPDVVTSQPQTGPRQQARARAWPRRLAGSVIPAGAVGIAILIAVASIALLRHSASHHAAGTGHPGVRGSILARNGEPLATYVTATAVRVDLSKLPTGAAARAAEYRRLFSGRPRPCRVPGQGFVRLQRLPCQIAQAQAAHLRTIVLGINVSPRKARLITAHAADLPGITIVHISGRIYPHGALAAQLLGTVGPPSRPTTAAQPQAGGIIGLSGLEYQYNGDLQAGDEVKLAIDPRLQEVGQQALAQSIRRTHTATGGAFVALDPTNGQILAMGSGPTLDPNTLTHIKQTTDQALTGPGGGYQLLNRTIQAAGPTGSAFTPITALQSGAWNVGDSYDDTGQFCFSGGGLCLHNAGHAVNGVIDLQRAIQVSSDDFFYNLGARLNADPTTHPNGGALQQWARKFGIGRSTGIDLPNATTGALPSPKYFRQLYQQEIECENATGPYAGHPKHPASQGGYGIANNPDWTIGDNVNTAVGQGDVQVSPLQLAVAYGALANGGTVVTPHVGVDVQTAGGTVLQKIDPAPARHLTIDPTNLDAIRAGLRAAASQPGGTSYDVMGNFPEPVYGKTGTAQYNGQQDYAWYAGFVPPSATNRPIVIVVTVDQGGFGDVSAAPVARQMLSQWFLGKPGPYRQGTSATL